MEGRKKMNNETYFYGIDFKKIELYCKVKFPAALRLKREFIQISKIKLEIDTDKFYKVEKVNFIDYLVTINVNCIKCDKSNNDEIIVSTEDRIKLNLSFDDVEFSYFFENTKEEELEGVIF